MGPSPPEGTSSSPLHRPRISATSRGYPATFDLATIRMESKCWLRKDKPIHGYVVDVDVVDVDVDVVVDDYDDDDDDDDDDDYDDDDDDDYDDDDDDDGGGGGDVTVNAQVATLCVARWKPWSWTCAFCSTKQCFFDVRTRGEHIHIYICDCVVWYLGESENGTY